MALVESLVRQCAQGEDAGWEQLWRFLEEAVSVPIQCALSASPDTIEDADDLRQELFLHLSQHAARRVRLFRGTTEAEFRGFLHVLAVRFVRARLARERLRRRRERAAWTARGTLTPGPGLAVLQARAEEFEAVLSPADLLRRRLLESSPASGAGALDPRTRRRWTHDLVDRYAGRVL